MDPLLVGILMGSDSDLPVMRDAAQILAEMGIGVDMHVMSAHRTPEDAAQFARTAAERGLRVIIAGAGGAAHLPGVLAAYTTLPVIGVPIASSTATLGGLDALLAIVQMPAGIPVATVAINGARNAGLLAAEILSIADESLRERLIEQRKSMPPGHEPRRRRDHRASDEARDHQEVPRPRGLVLRLVEEFLPHEAEHGRGPGHAERGDARRRGEGHGPPRPERSITSRVPAPWSTCRPP